MPTFPNARNINVANISQYKMSRELLAIQESAMHNAPLDENSILIQIIQQRDHIIVKSILNRLSLKRVFSPTATAVWQRKWQEIRKRKRRNHAGVGRQEISIHVSPKWEKTKKKETL